VWLTFEKVHFIAGGIVMGCNGMGDQFHVSLFKRKWSFAQNIFSFLVLGQGRMLMARTY